MATRKPRKRAQRARKRKGDGYHYRYLVITCPECGADFTRPDALVVQLAVAGANPEFDSQLDEMGFLDDPEGNVARGLHSETRCSTCGFSLWSYEDADKSGQLPTGPLPFKLSYDGLVNLQEFGAGDVPELARRLAKYLTTSWHQEIVGGESVDLSEQARKALARINALVAHWAEAAMAAILKHRGQQ